MSIVYVLFFFFFFQAEDGIRDVAVTGVQTCALPIQRARDVFKLAGLAALLSTTISATAGVVSLSLGGFAQWTDFGSIWSTWWMGDAVSDLVVAPAVLLWAARPRVRWTRRQALEAVGLLACLAVVGFVVFDGLVPWSDKHYPLEFLCVPFLLWVAFRFEQREAATVVVLLAGVAIWGTLRGYGPFARPLFNESLLDRKSTRLNSSHGYISYAV